VAAGRKTLTANHAHLRFHRPGLSRRTMLLSAPKSGYRADTALVVQRNVVVLVQANDAGVCGLALTGTSLYAKFQITEVNRLTRQLKIRWTADPNCGFVSFQTGVPKN